MTGACEHGEWLTCLQPSYRQLNTLGAACASYEHACACILSSAAVSAAVPQRSSCSTLWLQICCTTERFCR
jgi:hypothetical protein